MLLNVYAGISFGKSYQNDHYHTQHVEQFQEEHNIIAKKNGIIAGLNDSDAVALAKVMQKEPKFFDEFECKYNRQRPTSTLAILSN